MVSVRFAALVSEGFDPEVIRADVFEVGGSVSERDTPNTGEGGLRRSKPLVPESFVLPAEALQPS